MRMIHVAAAPGMTNERSTAQASMEPSVDMAPMLNTTAATGSALELSALTHILAVAEKRACRKGRGRATQRQASGSIGKAGVSSCP